MICGLNLLCFYSKQLKFDNFGVILQPRQAKDKLMKRRGEKLGWLGGWFGGFVWLGLLSAIWLFQNKISEGIIGLAVFIIAIIVISMTTPWKHPNTKYWKLMLPIYSLLTCSIVLYIYLSGGLEIIGLKWTSIFLVIDRKSVV